MPELPYPTELLTTVNDGLAVSYEDKRTTDGEPHQADRSYKPEYCCHGVILVTVADQQVLGVRLLTVVDRLLLLIRERSSKQ